MIRHVSTPNVITSFGAVRGGESEMEPLRCCTVKRIAASRAFVLMHDEPRVDEAARSQVYDDTCHSAGNSIPSVVFSQLCRAKLHHQTFKVSELCQ